MSTTAGAGSLAGGSTLVQSHSSLLPSLSIMPALDIDFSQQVKMATAAPEALEAVAPTMKRTCSGRSSNIQSNESAVFSKMRTTLQQPFKKRRLANTLFTPTLSSTSTNSSHPSTSQYNSPEVHHQSQSNGDSNLGSNGSDDLTNLNWLQDANLLKSIYSTDTVETDTSTEQATNRQVIALRRPPLKGHQHQNQQQPHQSQHRKPPYSYSALIFLAIESSPSKSMMVRDIYSWIVQNFPFFATAPAGWKNTIRHTLSLRKCFKKVDRCTGAEIAAGDSDSDSGDIKGGFWHVDSEYRATLQQLVARAQQNVLPKLVVKKAATERVLIPKKEIMHWGGGGVGVGGSKWLPKTTPLGDHYQNKQHNGNAHAVLSLPKQKFIQVPVIRSFFPHRYHPHHKVSRCLPTTTANMAQVAKTSAEAREASYKLQLSLNKLNSSSGTQRSVHIPRRPATISAATSRNSVSVISVNHAPKVYAPLPKVTVSGGSAGGGGETKSTTSSNLISHHHYHHPSYHCLHPPPLPPLPFRRVPDSQTQISNAKDHKSLPKPEHKAQFSSPSPTAAVFSSPHIVCPPSYQRCRQLQNCSASLIKGPPLSSSDEDDDDMLTRNGAEALLNFASGAFSLNRLIKQED